MNVELSVKEIRDLVDIVGQFIGDCIYIDDECRDSDEKLLKKLSDIYHNHC